MLEIFYFFDILVAAYKRCSFTVPQSCCRCECGVGRSFQELLGWCTSSNRRDGNVRKSLEESKLGLGWLGENQTGRWKSFRVLA